MVTHPLKKAYSALNKLTNIFGIGQHFKLMGPSTMLYPLTICGGIIVRDTPLAFCVVSPPHTKERSGYTRLAYEYIHLAII